MKLRNKLLLSFIAVITLMAVSGYFVLRWSFERGAHAYLVKTDKERLKKIAVSLSEYYELNQSWEAFEGDAEAWGRWIAAHDKYKFDAELPNVENSPPLEFEGIASDAPAVSTQNPKTLDDRRPSPVSMAGIDNSAPHSPVMPYFLLDEKAKLLVGSKAKQNTVRPVFASGFGAPKIVGFVGLPPPPAHIENFWREPFAARHSELTLIFIVCTLAISILAAIPLSTLLTRRIYKLHRYVSSLNEGEYEREISLPGNDELAKLGQNLSKLAKTLAESETQRRQLTADISHELRTPVSGLQSYIEAMQDDVLPLTHENLTRLHEQSRRLSKLINDLYQLSIADCNGMSFTMRPCNLGDLAKRIALAHEPTLLKKGLRLNLHLLATHPVLVWADEQRLAQVLTNLLENSGRYTDAPGLVEVSLKVLDGRAQLKVADSAPGVSEELHARLTERLFRVDTSRNRRSGGSGLGLNLCEAILEAHDGKLEFTHSELGGLAVTVDLPRYKVREN